MLRSVLARAVVPVAFLMAVSVAGVLTAPAEAPAAAEDGRTLVTFVGFHAFPDGSSRIFVKLTRTVPVSVQKADRGIEYTLEGAAIGVGNNKNPLLTQHFESPVMSARVESTGKAVALRVQLRESINPQHKLRKHPDGSATLLIDFPGAPSGGQ